MAAAQKIIRSYPEGISVETELWGVIEELKEMARERAKQMDKTRNTSRTKLTMTTLLFLSAAVVNLYVDKPWNWRISFEEKITYIGFYIGGACLFNFSTFKSFFFCSKIC